MFQIFVDRHLSKAGATAPDGERTATEILAAKNRQRTTVKAIQTAMEKTEYM